MNDLFLRIVMASTVRGTVLILFAFLAAGLARRFFGKNGAHWLWLATLPVLLWPVPPQTPLSLQNLWIQKKEVHVADPIPAPAAIASPIAVKIHQLEADPISTPSASSAHTPVSQITGSPASQPADSKQWLFWVWCAGALANLGQLIWRWLQTMRILREARPADPSRAIELLHRFPASARIRIFVTSQVRAPALAGIWRPRILLPEGWLEDLPAHKLEPVLLHELGHHLRGDLVWEWLFALARCLHWMNPAVWFAERMARHERELACDAWALEHSASPVHYGEALIDALQRVRHCAVQAAGVIAMADNVHQISRRLRWIVSYRPVPRWRVAVAWIPALLALVVVGSNPISVQADGPALTSAAAESAPLPPDPTPSARSEATEAPVDSLPLARRPVEMTTEIIRVPEFVANRLGWPIAAEGSQGIQRVISRAQFHRLIGSLGPQAELLPAPRLTSRSGHREQMEVSREFRYGEDYSASASGELVPASIGVAHLGLAFEWQADIKSETAAHLNVLPTLTRLAGFVDDNRTLTPPIKPPPGTDWYHRLVAYEMPEGTGGAPVISAQEGNADLDLTSDQTAIVFGFRDADRTAAPGSSKEETMVIYFAVQIDIAP